MKIIGLKVETGAALLKRECDTIFDLLSSRQEDLRGELLRGGTKPIEGSQASRPFFFLRPSYRRISNGTVSMSLAPSCSTYASTRVKEPDGRARSTARFDWPDGRLFNSRPLCSQILRQLAPNVLSLSSLSSRCYTAVA